MYKVLVIANNCQWKSWDKKLKALREWFAPKIELSFMIQHTDFKNVPFVNTKSSEGIEFKEIEREWFDNNISVPALQAGFDCVIFTMNDKEWGGWPAEGARTHHNLGVGEIQIGCAEFGDYMFMGVPYSGDKWFNIARHELTHQLYFALNKPDRTHYWWLQGDLRASLREISTPPVNPVISAIRGLFAKPKPILAALKRSKIEPKYTVGSFVAIDDVKTFEAKSLELPWLDNKPNISAIPKGVYECVWSFSPTFQRYTYELRKVPNRSGIRIHSANYVRELKGCIALGTSFGDIDKDGIIDLVQSKKAVEDFNKFINKRNFTLTIL